MNRSFYLERTLPTWLNKGFEKIIIIDWSSSEPVLPIIEKYQDGTIVYVRIDDQKFYNHSKAKNLRARFANDWFLSIDCDVKVKKLPALTSINHFYIGKMSGEWGTHLIHKETYFSVNGHNENLRGNVGDDGEFYNRLTAKSFVINKLDGLSHIHHSNELRVVHMEPKSKIGEWDESSIMQKFECDILYPDNTTEHRTT